MNPRTGDEPTWGQVLRSPQGVLILLILLIGMADVIGIGYAIWWFWL